MKKLKKIRIIEEGRTCSPEEMDEIRGGEQCTEIYLHCKNGGTVVSCVETSFTGYYSDSTGVFCADTHQYNQCAWGGAFASLCGGGETYHYVP